MRTKYAEQIRMGILYGKDCLIVARHNPQLAFEVLVVNPTGLSSLALRSARRTFSRGL